MSTDYYPKLQPGKIYHLFNQGNNRTKIFFKPENFEYFLRKYDFYLRDYLNTFCFCLMSNHFHFLIQVKPVHLLPKIIAENKESNDENKLPEIITEQFRRLFMSYSKAINKQEGRSGSLFRKNFKRLEVNDVQYFKQLVWYIHHNPQHHGLSEDYRMYPWSSYERIMSEELGSLYWREVIEWFGNKNDFQEWHSKEQNVQQDLIIE
jgi:REP element-mobilizing transposase RayT